MGKGKIRNQELYEKLKDLVIKAFALLEEKHKRGSRFEYTTIVEGGLVVDKSGSLYVFPEGRKCRRKPDFSGFSFKHLDELKQLPEWKNVTESLLKDRIISKQVRMELISPWGGFGLDESNILRRIINMSIDEKKIFRFNLDMFDSVYNDLEDYFYSNNVVKVSFSPLLGFTSELNQILLDRGVKIRRILKNEILDLWNQSGWFRALVEQNSMAFSIHSPLKYLVEVSNEAPKIAPDEKVSLRSPGKIFENVLSTLRLYKEGWVACPFIFSKFVSRLPSTVEYGRSGSLLDMPMGLSYELTKEEVKAFKTFYRETEGKLDNSRIALNKFNQTYRRENLAPQIYEDKIIDLCIAFESLFCREDTRQKSEIISTGASMLIGKDNCERDEIYNYLRKAYRVRNDIVHASQSISDSIKKRKIDDDLGIFIRKIENYLRLCINRLI